MSDGESYVYDSDEDYVYDGDADGDVSSFPVEAPILMRQNSANIGTSDDVASAMDKVREQLRQPGVLLYLSPLYRWCQTQQILSAKQKQIPCSCSSISSGTTKS